MAPKTCPPRRTPRTTGRKSVPSQCTTVDLKISSSSSSQESSDAHPLPSSAPATSCSELSSNDTGLLTSPDDNYNPKIVNSSSPEREITGGDEVRKGNIVKSGTLMIGISNCRDKDEIEGIADDGPELKGKDGDGSLVKVEKAASRTKKVVKKVRIVKKIVKRKVPKRVVKSMFENEVDATEAEKVGINGNVCVVQTEILKPNHTNEVDSTEAEKVGINGNDCAVQTEILKPNHTKEVDHTEAENVGINGNVCVVQTENLKPNHTVALELENEELKELKVEAVESSELRDSMRGYDASDDLVGEANDGKESEGMEDQLGNQNVQFFETKCRDSVDTQNGGTVFEGEELRKEVVENTDDGFNGVQASEGQREEGVKEVVENNDIEFNGMQSVEGVEEVVEDDVVEFNGGVALSGEVEAFEEEKHEVVKEIVEKNDVGLNGGVALSEEMEALERKKRRKTEIFIGGLDKDAKEEDIRNVFKQVGEVREVRLVMNGETGKNKGFAFLRFASAADARVALEKCSTVKICGKQCGAQLVEGNDTIFLGNINKNWKSEDVIKLLKDAGMEKIDKVTVMTNPSNFEQNRGFAFVEFETSKDAEIGISKLQKHILFNQMKVKVTWALPLIEPEEGEMLKVKSVYAEYLPPSWDEEKVRNFFNRFGEVESAALAKNLPSSKRKDFAFINYTKREAALACIEAFGHDQLDDEGSKLKVKVSLARPIRKGKQMKCSMATTEKELGKEKRKASQSIIKVHEPRKKGIFASNNLDCVGAGRTDSTTDELLQLLRQQALVGQTPPGSSTLSCNYGSPKSKSSFSALTHLQGTHPLPSVLRGLPRTHLETSHLPGSPSIFPHRVSVVSLPYSQQPRTSYTLESSNGLENDPYVKPKERANYNGHTGIYRRY